MVYSGPNKSAYSPILGTVPNLDQFWVVHKMVSLGHPNHWMNSKILLYIVLIPLLHIPHCICLNVMRSGLGPQRKSGLIWATFAYFCHKDTPPSEVTLWQRKRCSYPHPKLKFWIFFFPCFVKGDLRLLNEPYFSKLQRLLLKTCHKVTPFYGINKIFFKVGIINKKE